MSRASPIIGAWRLYPASSTSIEITYQVIRLQCSHCKAILLFIQILRPKIIFKLLHLQIIYIRLTDIKLRYWYLLPTQSWPYRWMHFNHSRVFWLMPEWQQEFIIHLSVWNWPASPCFALLLSMVPWSPPSWIHPKSLFKMKSVLVACWSHIIYLLKKFKSHMSWTLVQLCLCFQTDC